MWESESHEGPVRATFSVSVKYNKVVEEESRKERSRGVRERNAGRPDSMREWKARM